MTINISKIIVHKLNLGEDRPVFNENCINLDEVENSEQALQFFTKHIRKMRNYGFTKKCCFEGGDANNTKNSVIRIREHYNTPNDLNEVFIEESKRMTQHLRNEMRSTSSTSDGSIFVFLYSELIQDELENFVGILKMDPNTGIEVTTDLNIIVRPSMLPSPKENLHKSAFIKIIDNYIDDELHLFALDRQQGSADPARYFMQRFLNARELAGDRNLTKAYQDAVRLEFENVIPDEDFPTFNDNFKRFLSAGGPVNMEEDLPRIARETVATLTNYDMSEDVERVINHVREKYRDATSNFDAVSDKVYPTVYRTFDKSIEIKISPNVNQEWYTKTVNEETGEVIFTISNQAGLHQER